METTDRPPPTSIIDRLEQTPFAFDFFRAIRLLETQHPTSTRVGMSHSVQEDPIRFGQTPSLAFAPSSLEAFRPGQNGRPGKLLVRFLGLFGPNGPLPIHITEYAHERELNLKDRTLVEFCNVFHHRLLSLFYRAWAVNQKAVDFDRAAQPVENAKGENWSGPRFPLYIGSFFGLGMQSLRNRDELSDWAKLFYSGRLACQTRNTEGIAAIVQDFFGMPTEIRTFMGMWLELPPSNVCKVGESPASGSLGVSTIVGSRFWDCQLKFRVRLGPLSFRDFKRMLPIERAFRQLKCWVMNYVAEEFFWDIQLVLKAAEVPEISLGEAGLLGWTSWLKSKPFTRDAEDVVLNPLAA